MKLLTTENAKTVKGEKYGWLTGILYLAPAKVSGHQVCPHSDAACRRTCLFTAGRGRFKSVMDARIRKTKLLFDDRQGFIAQLIKDIQALQRRAKREKLWLAIRLNGTSDLPWHKKAFGEIIQMFPDVHFYGYTANLKMLRDKSRPKNDYLLFSRKSHNHQECMRALRAGYSVAAVFDKVPVGDYYWGFRVIDGDDSDLRFLENPNRKEPVIVGVKAKGLAVHDKSGFVIRRN